MAVRKPLVLVGNQPQQLQPGDTLWGTKAVEVDVGSAYVVDAQFTVTDADVGTTSLIDAWVTGIAPTDGRSPDEAYLDQIRCFVIPGNGQFTLRLMPARGTFKGKYVIAYCIGG